ncbi:protein KTI12 homolog [Homarus americanus]|uniref:protein KTI12 homolog n=1 Tax=Homarus americanus TaxID=6706 RepID=UPI001C4492FF|nr:protein KTI12 homolog [Homarus americanus]
MPLVIISGFPSSGKTRRTLEIKNYFESEKSKKVTVVSENELLVGKNEIFSDSKQEKEIRGTLKGDAIRLLNKDDIVILDAGNYIKGFRYELYCASKQIKTTQCLVQCVAPIEQAWTWNQMRPENERYTREVFDGLVMRYETPNSSNRWDSPMFTVLPEDAPPCDPMHDALYLCKPPPPNQSTQTQPLSSTNFLFELDRTTQDVTSCIMSAQRTLVPGDSIKVPGVEESISLGRKVTLAEVTRARRQFISYTKMHPVEDTSKLMSLFIRYLNSTLG